MHMPAHLQLVWCKYKIAHINSVYETYYPGYLNEENERKIKKSNWVADYFSLTFLYLSSFLPYTKHSCVSLLEPQQKNVGHPEAYLESCQRSKMGYFAKIVNC